MRKGTRNIIIAVVAVFAAALFACLIVLAALPAGTGARYAEEELYSGAVANDGNSSHSHSTAITDSTTISSAGSYYLTDDVTGDITITASGSNSSNPAVVNICLNGHVLTGTGSGSVITVGNPSTSYYVTVNLYDCGGNGDVHYYRYLYEDGDAVVDGEIVPSRYDFDLTDEEIEAGGYDGYIRGGLITGGNATSNDYGGGVTIGKSCTLNMYGGTIAGNEASGQYGGGGVSIYAGTLNLYGGIIEGNYCLYDNTYNSAGGVMVCGKGYLRMYGGEIKHNHNLGDGGGVLVYSGSGSIGVSYVYMYGGIVSGNYSAGTGGGIQIHGFNSNYSYFYMYGGIVSDNVSKGNGGGIYLPNSAKTEIHGGIVTGNRSLEGIAGGIGYGNYSLSISGTPYIYGNYAAGKNSNLELNCYTTKYYLTMTSPLEEGARVGITAYNEAGRQITSTGTDADVMTASVKYFLPDDPSYGIEIVSNSYLRFYKKSA